MKKKILLFLSIVIVFITMLSGCIVNGVPVDPSSIYKYGFTVELDKYTAGAGYTADNIYINNATGENITEIKYAIISSTFDDHSTDTTTEPDWTSASTLSLSGGYILNGSRQNFNLSGNSNKTIFFKIKGSSSKYVVFAVIMPDALENYCWRAIVRTQE